MMLRSRLEDVFRLPDLAAGLGVDQVVISTLDYVAEPGLKVETLDDLSLTEEKELDARLTELAKNARKRGLDITWRLPTLKTAPSPGCPENVGRALVISEEGGVRPCVFWNLPPSGEVKPEAVSRRAPDFGRLDRASLIEIWKAEDYRSFRAEWASGGIPAPCRGCPKPFRG
jgi:MoaA/NifB/PqqE/SkfB family radical SAM enzyme